MDLLHVSFSNPSGLRGKEATALSLPYGVHSFSETQLSAVTQRSCAARLRFLAREQQRNLRLHLGAAVAVRSTSNWAGAWSGVATLSELASQEVMLPYAEERECGRALVTRHVLGKTSLLNAVVYGYPAGPSWPRAKQLTSQLVGILTTEVVLGAKGPRIIGGDFNVDSNGLQEFEFWRSLGWQSAQDHALQHWSQPKSFTCKHVTERDLLWLSPEAIALCKHVDVAELFHGHATISVGLEVPLESVQTLVWPRPSKIPYDEVDERWQLAATPPLWDDAVPPDEQWQQWASSFESCFDGFLPHQPDHKLQRNQCGRLHRTAPMRRVPQSRILRPSRPSEVALRNDLVGHEVHSWFRQLRRLQSYLAAIRAGKQTAAAIAYRFELWHSILRSPGFCGGFPHWWTCHCADDTAAFPWIPNFPPGPAAAASIFHSFRERFQRFESWHLRQRAQLLKAKYDKGMSGIFQDLRKQPRDRLDFLQATHEYGVLAVEGHQVHVDRPIQQDGTSHWSCDNGVFSPEVVNEVTMYVGFSCQVGDILCQHQTIADVPTLHQRLLTYWRQTWCAMEQVPPDVWQRVTAFFKAYVPALNLTVPELNQKDWKRTIKRFKPTAARGVDGISHLDLQALPDAWTDRLLDLFRKIETGQHSWPTAIRYGVVGVIAKDLKPSTIDRYRPIVIFSVLYRAWASLRARQLLHRIAPYMPSEALGFLPGCEPSQLWTVLQGEVECALQGGHPLCGLSTVLIRAFNNIPRQHTFALASHLGVSEHVLVPWQAFLATCTRSFELHGTLSASTTSTCGLPEGDALSVFAMVQLNFAWHIYMAAFAPQVRSISFVDNLAVVAAQPDLLAAGLVCLMEFFKLWNLAVEAAKSYCWAVLQHHKKQLCSFPFQRVDAAHELGGILSFTKRAGTGLQKKRYAAVTGTWSSLRRSWAPLWQKLAVIPTTVWSSALHGIYGFCFGESHLDALRRQAISALKLQTAGSNPFLRLTLSSTPSADPGLWRAQHVLHTFRRLVTKEPRFLSLWRSFMAQYQGDLYSGPFSQLVRVLNQLGWSINPPFVLDHDGCEHHLLQLDAHCLQQLVHDAWLQYVAQLVQHRKTMTDLRGIDMKLVASARASLSALETSLVSALQSGAFTGAAQHGKYDLTKDGNCQLCRVPDTPTHWLACPRYANVRTRIDGWQDHAPIDTVALTEHLLPSRSPFAAAWKQAILCLPDATHTFWSHPAPGHNHVFTDGSADQSGMGYDLAAWSCINATTGQVIAAAPLHGLSQTNDRAELMAVLSALQWQHKHQVHMDLWIDALHVVQGLNFVLQHGVAGHWKNSDIWTDIVELLASLYGLQTRPHWIPSHLDANELSCPFEDWIKKWNDHADILAGRVNHDRPAALLKLQSDAQSYHRQVAARLKQLRAFYFLVADDPKPAAPELVPVNDFDEEQQFSLNSLYMPEFFELLSAPSDSLWISHEFVSSLLQWLLDHSDEAVAVYDLSVEEFALLLVSERLFRFPFWVAASHCYELFSIDSRFERPTLAYLVSCIKRAFSALVSLNGVFGDVLFNGHAKVHLGIHRPVCGVFVRLQPAIIEQGCNALRRFTTARALRKSCDWARPA